MLFRHPRWFRLLRTRFRRKVRAAFVHRGPVWGQSICGDLPLGRCTMAKNGCEIIAVYNALRFAGREMPLDALIGRYEAKGWIMAWGHLGSDPYAAGEFFPAEGVPCRVFSDYETFAHAIQQGRVFVLSYWLKDSLFSGAHGITLVRSETGLWACNLYNNQQSPRKIHDLSEILTPGRFIVGYEIG